MSSTYERIYAAVRRIPAGRVATYGDIARAVGTHPRVVGNALHVNPAEALIPCHRIVNAKGQLAAAFAFGGATEQAERLHREGVTVIDGRANLATHRFKFE